MKKRKKELTPEQIAARDARRSKFRALSKQIAAMTPEARAALAARMPAIVTIEGRALSCFNSCLLIHQNPGATVVGGFRQWIAHGRAVRKGEHGACIWVPCFGKAGESGPVVPDSEGAHGDTEAGDRRFVMATVFDVSQTSGIAAGEPGEAVDIESSAPDATPRARLELAPAGGGSVELVLES